MIVGRFSVIVPMLAVADTVSAKKTMAMSGGTFPTDGVLFVVLLVGTVVIVGALNFFPALCLGPIVEHLMLLTGKGM
jgi:K+-transporting ATPase ATPase A chain